MSKKLPIVYGTFMLTAVNLLLHFFGTAFQVYLSSTIGAVGVGLLHLILSVAGLSMTAGIAGIRTTTMYLTAEQLGRKQHGSIRWVLSGCFTYCIICSSVICLGLYFSAPYIAQHWIGNMDALPSLRTFSAFLPISCLCSVMTGYFVAANRIATLAAIEVAEQFASMGVTVLILLTVPAGDIAHACQAVILGNCAGSVLTLFCLLAIYGKNSSSQTQRIPIAHRICTTAAPLALADDLKAGISSLEHLMVPKRLALYPLVSNPLATFGIVAGMVFPVMMFPAAILFSLVDILIPELARCAAADSRQRIEYLMRRNLRVTLIYGLICGGSLFLLADPICQWLFPGIEAAKHLRKFSLLVPMLYCDIIVDGITKGLGQQRYCVRFNIISNALDVLLLFFLLPTLGMDGYFISFLISHVLNFILSVKHLLHIGKLKPDLHYPCFALCACLIAILGANTFTGPFRKIASFLGLFFCLCYFFGVITAIDVQWLRNLLKPKENLPSM